MSLKFKIFVLEEMRRFFILFFVFGFVPVIAAQQTQQRFKFVYNKNLSSLRFLETLSGHDTKTDEQTLNYLFSEEDEVLNKIIQTFNEININYSYHWEDFPESRRGYRSTYDLVITTLANSQNLDEVAVRLIGIIPNEDLTKFIYCLKGIAPYYEQFITSKYSKRIEQEISKYQSYAGQLDEVFKKAQTFYGTSWPENVPFIVSMYPIPGKAGFTTADPHGNTIMCSYLIDGEADYKARLGVIAHELNHVLYDQQSISLQVKIEQWFSKNKSAYKQLAYKYFDEGLATAVGNGWGYQFLNGQMDTATWYNNEYINGYAKELYPLVETYINENKTIDSLFVGEAIQLFEKRFGNSMYEYIPLFNSVTIFSNTEDRKKVKGISETIKKYFQMYSYYFVSPIKDDQTNKIMKSSKGTKLFIIDGRYRSNMNYLKQQIPNLEVVLQNVRVPYKRNQYISYVNDEQEAVIIMMIGDLESLDKILKAVSDEKNINIKNPFHEVE